MKFQTMLAGGLVALLAISTAAYAADQKKDAANKDTPKAETKTAETPVTSSRGAHVVKPYSDLKDLSSEQEAQLKSIHAKYLAEINELKSKEKDESMAVLSDDQKKELVEVTAKLAAEKKVAAANAKAQKASQTK